jgi:LuxR family maltose regulon positive regulatory protein
MLECVWSAYAVMARIAACRSHIERAHALLERGRFDAAISNLKGLRQDAESVHDHNFAVRACRGPGNRARPGTAAAVGEFARLYFNEGRVSEGRRMRRSAGPPCGRTSGVDDLRLVRHRVDLLSVVCLRAGKLTDALNGFRGVLGQCAQAGMYQTILDEGPNVGILLTTFQESAHQTGHSRDELGPYIDRLIAGWQLRHGSQAELAPKPAIVESLSAREGDILRITRPRPAGRDC